MLININRTTRPTNNDNIRNSYMSETDKMELQEKKSNITVDEILNHYKNMLKDLEKKYNKERKRVRKFKTQYAIPRHCDKTNEEDINPLLKQLYNPPVEGALSEAAALTIWANKSKDKKFIRATCNLNYPQIKTLSINHMNKIRSETDTVCLNKLLAHSIINPLEYLHLSSEKHVPIKKFMAGVRPLLNQVKKQVTIKGFNLDGKDLKQILENARNSHTIILYNCTLETILGLNLDSFLDYNTKVLDLYKTAAAKKKHRIHTEAMETLAAEISNTPLKESLTDIYVQHKSFHPNDVSQIFRDNNMRVRVTGEDTWPFTHVPANQAEELAANPNNNRRVSSSSFSPPSIR